MKYGREVTIGSQVRLTEVVTIPPGVPDVAEWLSKRFPTLLANGWVQVDDLNENGAVKQGNGTYLNPTIPPPPAPPGILSATAFMDVAILGLKTANSSTQAAAEARFQEILEAAKTFAGSTETAKRVRYSYERYAKAITHSKETVAGILALFKSAGVAALTDTEESAILAAWV